MGLYPATLRGASTTTLGPHNVPDADFTGRWIVVTGANNGVGFEAAKRFAAMGANLVLGCREPPSHETHPLAAVDECSAMAKAAGHGDSTIEWWPLEMTELRSVDAFAQRWLDTGRALDVLCNNAGMSSFRDKTFTKDGFETIHQVNFLSHVLLTLRLLPSVAKSNYARIVCTTSCLHYMGVYDLDHFNGEPGGNAKPYEDNKLYYQMWLVELQNRLVKVDNYKHITINGLHPGFVKSGIWAPVTGDTKFRPSLRIWTALAGLLGISAEQGGWSIVHAATSPALNHENGGGKFFNRIWEDTRHPLCNDSIAQLRLWQRLDGELDLSDKGLLERLDPVRSVS